MFEARIVRPTALGLAVAIGVSGCATLDKQAGRASYSTGCVAGAVIGSLAGAAIANVLKKDVKTGALAGGAIGCGATMAYQSRVKRLEQVAREEGLKMQVQEIQVSTGPGPTSAKAVGLEALVQDSMFPTGSAALSSQGEHQMRKVALALVENQKDQKSTDQRILVVGHTDSTGSAEFNQRLSEQRARAVGRILAEVGINPSSIYYQGAGASRPIADNSTEHGRASNRRVELSQVDSQQVLVQRVREERNNSKYLAHSTRSTPVKVTDSKAAKNTAQKKSLEAKSVTSEPTLAGDSTNETIAKKTDSMSAKGEGVAVRGNGIINFAGAPVKTTRSDLAKLIDKKSSAFNFITPAYADIPMESCIADLPRVAGEVKNLATGQALAEVSTTDYLPGLNGRPWGQVINGHVAMVGPVSILKNDAQVVQQPYMQFITNYQHANKKETNKFLGVANTYDGETKVLYRVYASDLNQSPVSCMDIVFDKRTGKAVGGELFYPKKGEAYVAQFNPIRR